MKMPPHLKRVFSARHIYEVLGVHHNANEDEVDSARNSVLREVHPDRNLSHTEAATQAAAIVTQAATIINGKQSHAKYRAVKFARLGKCSPCKGNGYKTKTGKGFVATKVVCERCHGSGMEGHNL